MCSLETILSLQSINFHQHFRKFYNTQTKCVPIIIIIFTVALLMRNIHYIKMTLTHTNLPINKQLFQWFSQIDRNIIKINDLKDIRPQPHIILCVVHQHPIEIEYHERKIIYHLNFQIILN